MRWRLRSTVPPEAVLVRVFADERAAAMLPAPLGSWCARQLGRERRAARPVAAIPALGALPQRWLVAALAPPWDDASAARRQGALIGRCLAELGESTAALLAEDLPEEQRVEPWLIGLAQGAYIWDRYRRQPAPKLEEILVVGRSARWRAALRRVEVLDEALTRCRDLTNLPAEELGPAEFVAEARRWLAGSGVRLRVFDERACQRLGLRCLLTVGRASPRRPRLLRLELPGRARTCWSLCGKGVCFDTGGLNLKNAEGMQLMRKDMAGAATVLAALWACARLGPLALTLRAYLPLADNAIDGASYRPGDVLRAADGTTIEVTNTDAEGRLLLADAVCLARREGAQAILSVASLTGAALIALGRIHVPLLATDERLAERLLVAARAAGEKLWRLPLDDEHRQLLRGQHSDLVNSPSSPDAGCIVAGAFVAHFAGPVPFAHCDISPASWQPKAGERLAAGATGVLVTTLVEALCG